MLFTTGGTVYMKHYFRFDIQLQKMCEPDPLTQFNKVFLIYLFLWNMKPNTWNQAMILHFIILIKYFTGAADIKTKESV